jgi:hypothetical protein
MRYQISVEDKKKIKNKNSLSPSHHLNIRFFFFFFIVISYKIHHPTSTHRPTIKLCSFIETLYISITPLSIYFMGDCVLVLLFLLLFIYLFKCTFLFKMRKQMLFQEQPPCT